MWQNPDNLYRLKLSVFILTVTFDGMADRVVGTCGHGGRCGPDQDAESGEGGGCCQSGHGMNLFQNAQERVSENERSRVSVLAKAPRYVAATLVPGSMV
mgnify:FL=1